jgi:uncharacterized protein DUF6538
MARGRSGSHLIVRGETYHYRRAVPAKFRKAFGQWEVTKSLYTTSLIEAQRLEKACDVEFEAQLSAAREAGDPQAVAARITASITTSGRSIRGLLGVSKTLYESALTGENREIARSLVDAHLGRLYAHRDDIHKLLMEFSEILPSAPLAPEVWTKCRADMLSVIRYQIGQATQTPMPDAAPTNTLEWAYDRWLRAGEGDRTPDSIAIGRRHFAAFKASAKVTMLNQVTRRHLVDWRDALQDARKPDSNIPKYKPKSINQRLQMVSAILRVGWRDAEMPQPDLKAITLPEPDDSGRGAWTRDEILKALTALEPQSWQAWLFLVGLTTSVRLGEPVAAQRDWWNPIGFIELRDRALAKADKEHAMPIIECLRGSFAAYVAKRQEGFLFDAPRPANPDVPISNVASKSLNRFFKRHEISRCFHELRDTWIEEARHSPVKKEIWEIISGHSARTVSDRYGGEKPDVLAEANEAICKFLTDDAEVKASMLRLVN